MILKKKNILSFLKRCFYLDVAIILSFGFYYIFDPDVELMIFIYGTLLVILFANLLFLVFGR
ncbi:hypothetical protein ACFL21_05295, partial [Patescibacteria group bacterium]